MEIKELNDADITLVEIVNGYPYCKKHGAMNKITGDTHYWRCVHVAGKINENLCRAGCIEVRP